MKKLLTGITLALVLCASTAWAAAVGTVTQALYVVPNSVMRVLTFTATASADDASFPSTDTSAAITAAIQGTYITEVRTNPGAPAPTALYDIVLNDTDGIDLMGGTLADRSATLSQRAIPLMATGVYGGTAIDGALTLVITGNAVNSATVTIKVFLMR